jgi:hypothetical protein
MSTDFSREPERDPELGGLLREIAGPQPSVDWEALRGRITASAELPLARARRARRGTVSPLMRALLPLAAAAGLAGAYVALRPAPGLDAGERAMVDQMVEASLPESVDQLITGEAAQGALLEVVAGS